MANVDEIPGGRKGVCQTMVLLEIIISSERLKMSRRMVVEVRKLILLFLFSFCTPSPLITIAFHLCSQGIESKTI